MAGHADQSVSIARVEIGFVTPAQRSAGIVVVRNDGASWQCLLLRAYRDWDFPKGLIEDGESPLAAARREAAEETSLRDLAFDWGEVFCETAPYARGKIARYYLARLQHGDVSLAVNPELGRPEHHEYRWVSIAGARLLVAPRLLPIVDWVAAQLLVVE